jgi:hypothetical protein
MPGWVEPMEKQRISLVAFASAGATLSARAPLLQRAA